MYLYIKSWLQLSICVNWHSMHAMIMMMLSHAQSLFPNVLHRVLTISRLKWIPIPLTRHKLKKHTFTLQVVDFGEKIFYKTVFNRCSNYWSCNVLRDDSHLQVSNNVLGNYSAQHNTSLFAVQSIERLRLFN